MPFFQNIHYNIIGNGPAIMLIHGFPDNSNIWNDIAIQLSNNFTVISPDLPGSGKSLLNGSCSIEDFAIALRLILDYESINKVLVVGHSMGGYISLAYSRLFPESLVGISLVHSTARADDIKKIESRYKAIELIKNGGKIPFVKQLTVNLFDDEFVKYNKTIVESKLSMGLSVSEEGLVNFYNAMINRVDSRDLLKILSIPVQLILGKNDSLINYRLSLSDSVLCKVLSVSLYNKCGHMSLLEKPDAIISDLFTFAKYCYR